MKLPMLMRLMLLAFVMLATSVTTVHAKVAPYSDWLFLLDRAKGDAKVVRELAQKKPELARIWFYGYIFDLSIAGIRDQEKARIRAHATIIAQVLAETELHDDVPLLLVESTPEVLRAYFDSMQAMLNLALNDEYPVEAVIRAAGNVGNELVPHAGFYALLHRADVANPRLGGRNDARQRLEAARGLAEMLAMIEGDLAPWRTLAAFRGETGVRPDPPTIPETRVCEGLNAIASVSPTSGRAAIIDGQRAVSTANASPLRVALLGLGPALVAEQAGEFAVARGGLAGAVNRVPQPWMRLLLLRRALHAAVRAGDGRSAVVLADALEPLLVKARPDPADDRTLIEAVTLWLKTGESRIDAGELDGAAQMLAPAARWTQWLRRPRRVGETVPNLARAQATRSRSALAAEVGITYGRLQLRLGQTTSAVESFRASREMFLVAEQPERAAVTDLALADAQLQLGDLNEALERANAALVRLDASAEDAARGLAMRSEIRLRRGELPPAFVNANAGLARLKRAGLDTPALRARLHLLAAAALHADGQFDAARARLKFSLRVLDTRDVALALAESWTAAGQVTRAMSVLRSHAQTPEGGVALGCIEARAARFDRAAARLAPMIDAVHRDLDLSVRARACLAIAWNGLGKRQQALALGALTDAEWAAADPAERWALHAAIAAANGPRAPMHRMAAIDDWRLAQADGHLRGLLDRRPQALLNVGAAARAIVDADLARAEPDWARSLPVSLWWRQAAIALSSAAPRPDIDMKSADLWALRGAHLAARTQGRLIADAALEPAARDAAITTRAAAWKAAKASLQARLAKVQRWSAYAAPMPPSAAALTPSAGRAFLFVQTGTTRSRVWFRRPGDAKPTFANVPGRGGLSSLRLGIEGHLTAGQVFASGAPDPHTQGWTQLMEIARTLAPQLVDPEVAPITVEVFADDGPLAFFPWGALVTALPVRGGDAPTFLVDRFRFVHRMSAQPARTRAQAKPGLTLLCAGGCASPMPTLVARTATRGASVTRPDGLAITTPLAHVEGIVDDKGVRIGEARHGFAAWGRLSAQPFQIAVAGEVRGGRARLVSSLVHGGAQSVVLPVGSAPTSVSEPLLTAWSAAIGRGPVSELVFTPGPSGNKLVSRLTPIASPGAPLGHAMDDAQRSMARAPAELDAVPSHHPSQWARWLVTRP